MRHIVCGAYGPPSSLQIVEGPDPIAGPGEVVVAVEAAGVNFVDALFVQGTYQIKLPTPFTPGGEIAGRVVSVGDGASGLAVGERVLASMASGGYATHVVIPARSAIALPDGLEVDRAAAFVQSYSTCWYAFTRRTQITSDDIVLVLGAGGGIGLAAVDLARHLGATVIAAASSEAKLAAARAQGAHHTIDYSVDDLKVRAKELSGGGVTVVVDPVGGTHAESALRSLGWGGRYLIIGFAGGSIPRFPLNQVLLSSRAVIGVDWGAWMGRSRDGQGPLLRELLDLAEEGSIAPVAPTRRALDDAAAVLDDAVNGRLVGKTVLVPSLLGS